MQKNGTHVLLYISKTVNRRGTFHDKWSGCFIEIMKLPHFEHPQFDFALGLIVFDI